MIKKTLNVNGITRDLVVDPADTLANVLRENLGLTAVKIGCNTGQCGACSVIMNGKLVRSCITKMKRIEDGSAITTLEGIGTLDNLHPIQLSWIANGGAQCGFCTPGFILSTKVLLETNPSPTRDQVRDWFQKHKNVCRCTGYKPLVDAVMDAAKLMRGEISKADLTFKIPENNRIWGTRFPRPSAIAKVTGTCDFGADQGLKMPAGTLRLALVQAKLSHARILSLDTSVAEKMPGVFKVLTSKDIQGKNRINGFLLPESKADGWDRPILCDTKVFQFGDALAIVCAETEDQAKAAAEKVKVELEPLPEYMSAPAAMADDAMEIHPGTPNVFFTQNIIKGEETRPFFNNTNVIAENDFYVGRQPHMPIEPDVGFAYYDDKDDLIIHCKSIAIHLHQAMIVDGLGIDPEKLKLVQNPAGGTFGYKFSPTNEALIGAACMATKRPVTLNYTWYQQQTYTGKRSPFFINLKLAADKSGRLLAMESDWTVDHGAYSEFGDNLTQRGAQFMGAGYDIQNIRGQGRTVFTNHAWGSAFRGYGAPQSEFASEVLMDQLAEKLNMDPLEFRYKNVYRKGATNPSGQAPDAYSLPEMIDILRPGYKTALESARKRSTDKVKCGVGISLGVYGCGLDGPDASLATVALNPDNTVTLYDSWEDHGQGSDMGSLGTAHEALRPLGLTPDKISLVKNDMRTTPDSGPAGGSRSQVMVGQAIKAACENLLKAMAKPDGTFRTHDEMKQEEIPVRYDGAWTAPGEPIDENGQGSPFSVYMYGLFMAETDVEIASGKTDVTKMTLVADVGKINNQLVVDGQLYGGLAQGIGLALSEDYEDIKKHATMKGAGIPYIKDIPDNMELIYVQTPREHGPFGAAGCGELPLTCPHAAVINAIYNACGARITRLPAKPEKVLAALKKQK